ncbi:hypothetical protein MHYP_G00336110 [Metynnis hypsauchen]
MKGMVLSSTPYLEKEQGLSSSLMR